MYLYYKNQTGKIKIILIKVIYLFNNILVINISQKYKDYLV